MQIFLSLVFATCTTDLPANEGRNKRPEAKGNIFCAVLKAEEDVLVPASLVLVCWYMYDGADFHLISGRPAAEAGPSSTVRD